MKKFLAIYIFLIAVNLAVPFAYSKIYGKGKEPATEGRQTDNSRENRQTVFLYDLEKEKVTEIPLLDYLIGCAACEMPASYEENAIKAQMIAAHSYYLYCKENPGSIETDYITFNESNMQTWRSKETLNRYWGSSYYDYYEKFTRCANRVINSVVTYGGQPALTSYFAMSRGKTESSENRWGKALPYLVSVESPYDVLSEDNIKIKEFTVSELYTMLKSYFPNLKISEETPENWFGDITYFDSGYAQYVTIGIDKVPADQLRDCLKLQSTCVMFFYEDGKFSAVTKGYGHGVGLSQYGANQMSQNGSDYKEILSHYYPGTEIAEIS